MQYCYSKLEYNSNMAIFWITYILLMKTNTLPQTVVLDIVLTLTSTLTSTKQRQITLAEKRLF
jgi:hypothetical protein